MATNGAREKSIREKAQLSSRSIDATTMREAFAHPSGVPHADEKELQWTVDQFKKNQNSPELNAFKEDGYYFFFGTVSGNYVTCLHRAGTKLDRMATWLGGVWRKDFYVVGSD